MGKRIHGNAEPAFGKIKLKDIRAPLDGFRALIAQNKKADGSLDLAKLEAAVTATNDPIFTRLLHELVTEFSVGHTEPPTRLKKSQVADTESAFTEAVSRVREALGDDHRLSADELTHAKAEFKNTWGQMSSRFAFDATMQVVDAAMAGKDAAFRSPEEVVDGIWAYNASLGLDPKDITAKLRHTLNSTNIFMRTNPQTMGEDLQTSFRHEAQLLPGEDSPIGVTIGDCHLGNIGSTSLSRFFPDEKKAVLTVVDRGKVGKAPIEWDIHRLVSTTLTAAWAKKGGEPDEHKLRETLYRTYLKELADYAFDPKFDDPKVKPHGYIRKSVSKATKQLLDDAPASIPKETLKKFTRSNETKFEKQYRIDDPKVLKALQKAFKGYAQQVGAAATFEPLDYGAGQQVGGSGSGLMHYYVLANVTEDRETYRTVIHFKRLIPAPFGGDETSTPEQRMKDRARINGLENPLEGHAVMPGKAGAEEFLVHPYDDSETTVEVDGDFDDTADLATDAARVIARLHCQTVSRTELRTWLTKLAKQGADPRSFPEASERGAAFAKRYAKVSSGYLDALANDPRLKKH